MRDAAIPAPTAPVTAQDLDRERGILLARPVGLICGVGLALIYLILLVLALTTAPKLLSIFPALSVGWLLCEGLLLGGSYLATRRQGNWAARCIVTGFLGAVVVFQVAWAHTHQLDAIALILFMAHVVPIGLSIVLEGSTLLFITCSVTTGFTVLFLVSNATLPWYELVGSGAVIIAIAWTVGALVYGSSRLYEQALDDVGMLRQAYERALQLDALKDQFITHVNHELRTPIMTLQGTIEFLHTNHSALPPELAELTLAQSHRSATRLVELVSSILDVRQIERRPDNLDLEAVDLQRAVVAACELVDPRQQQPIVITIPDNLALWGDRQMVIQILTNLLANAIKYSPERTPIALRGRMMTEPVQPPATWSPQPMIEVTVQDHGLGIPPEQIPLLFERFVRLPRDLASTVSGSGVGLYLCRVLAESMGGWMGVTSAGIPGEGSTFLLYLPKPPAEALTPTHPRVRAARRVGI